MCPTANHRKQRTQGRLRCWINPGYFPASLMSIPASSDPPSLPPPLPPSLPPSLLPSLPPSVPPCLYISGGHRRCRTPNAAQVPVLASFPSPLVPPTSTDNDALPLAAAVVAPPHRARLREDMWVSSRTFYVLDAEVLWTVVTYEVLRSTSRLHVLKLIGSVCPAFGCSSLFFALI